MTRTRGSCTTATAARLNRWAAAAPRPARGGRTPPAEGRRTSISASCSASGFADIFRQFTGGAAPRSAERSHRGTDIQHALQVPFVTAVQGGEARLSVHRANGRQETITVKIPPGVADGNTIRLRGQGEPGPRGGAAGDILVTVRVEPHPYFVRQGQDLELKVPVTLTEAVLGAKVEVPTPKGTITLKIPPGTSSGRRLRVKGHGLPGRRGEVGDLYAVVQIALPARLDPHAVELLQRTDWGSGEAIRADLKW